MRPATAVAVLVAGIGGLLFLNAGPQAVLYWTLVIPSVLLFRLVDGPWDLAIAIVAVIVFLVHHTVPGGRCYRRISGPSRGAMAEEETT